jgi:peptidoglycan hydrolase-like protein with peptidoglycan-binding domain
MTAIKKFQSDAGLTVQDGITTPMIFKALLNTDAFILISGGDSNIRIIQRNLNRDYNSVIGLIPSDGVYSRSTNVALIKALQHEQVNSPDGFWGANTMNACPTIPGSNSTKNFILLLQYALYCNGFNPNGFDGLFGPGLKTAITNFQQFSHLTADGYAGGQTWASLLVSTGDNTRRGTACDCATTITAEKAAALINNGYEIVGRYLTGNFKMTSSEIKTIFANGLRIFPIYETAGTHLSYFSTGQGILDVNLAINAARELGFTSGTIIYFAVDYDAINSDVESNILPYFKAINEEFNKLIFTKYKIGIYAPRNVCSSVAFKGYSCSSFVCDMSTGFSGNLGYSLPNDWAFDQISTITIGSGTGSIEINNNICSGKDIGVSSVNSGNLDVWTPNSTLATLVSAAGFLCDPSQDIIYSKMNPLQRDFGYCKRYDESAATLMSAIIDCEPIYFTYGTNDWLIELWKGQYGLETGAEIGIYNRDSGITDLRDAVLGKFFNCVSDSQRLNMSFVLKKDGVEIFRRGP